MSRLKLYKSPDSDILYIESVGSGHIEDYRFTRDGDRFTIDSINTQIKDTKNALYSTFCRQDGTSFEDADEFENYLNTINVIEATEGIRGSVNNHSDVFLNKGAVPIDGWKPIWFNNELILCMKEHFFYKGLPVINTNANNDINDTPLRATFNFQRTGNYKITVGASYSIDSTSGDIVVIPSIDNQRLPNIFNGEMLRKEGKDVAGNNNDGRGTDQKNRITAIYHYLNTTIGEKEILIDHFPTQNRVEAALWDVFIEVEEIYIYINANA